MWSLNMLKDSLTYDIKMYMLEVSFKPNSTSQNRFVRWGLHPLIDCELTLFLIDMRLPTIS